MTAPELKPCPFCGSEVEIKREPKVGWIKCTDPNSACIGSGLGFAFIIADEETAISAWNTRTASIPAPGADYVAGLGRVKHVKRGSTYAVLGRGKIQTDVPLTDYAEVVIYRGEEDGMIWVRPVSEFDDGRFAALSARPTDTRVVTVAQLERWAENMGNVGNEFPAAIADETASDIRAIIGGQANE